MHRFLRRHLSGSIVLRRRVRFAAPVLLALLAACQSAPPPAPPTQPAQPAAPEPIAAGTTRFADLPGWAADDHGAALEAFRRSCARPSKAAASAFLAVQAQDWKQACAAADAVDAGNSTAARVFFERHFVPVALRRGDGQPGLFTGYFEPALRAVLKPDARHRLPIYRKPPEIAATPAAPFLTRRQIEAGALKGRGLELAWTDDAIGLFELQIQGSGRLLLPGGRTLRVGFAGHNGQPYTAIGRILSEYGAGPADAANWPAIKAWLVAHPAAARQVMLRNDRYVFFRELTGEGPLGAQGVPLSPGRSVAVDPAVVPYGAPVWIDTVEPAVPPAASGGALRRLVVAQDTGGAIRGPVRGDIFFGAGARAEAIAGHMKAPGQWWVLLPRAAAERVARR